MSVNGSQATSTSKQQYALPTTSNTNPNPPSPHAVLSVPASRLALFAARQPDAAVNSFSGAVAGIASGVVTCPLDVIKTKLQGQAGFRPRNGSSNASGRPSYRGMRGTALIIWQQDGIRGMYRGLGPMVFGYLPTWAVYMSVYGASRDYYYSRMDNKWLAQTYASITAGACSTITTNPIWVIKTRLMSQVGSSASKDTRTPWHYHNTLDAFRKMYKSEGIGSFYSGLGPALVGLTHVAIQFPLYEFFKKEFTGVEMGQQTDKDGASHTVGILSATFLSKVFASVVTYPHEVLRTRLQTQTRRRAMAKHELPGQVAVDAAKGEMTAEVPRYQGILRTCRTIVAEEGWRAFYYGMGTNLVRAVPAAMTTMLTFETVKQYVQRLQSEGGKDIAGR